MPRPMTSVIAGRPAFVAGILIITFGRSTSQESCLASATVAPVLWARRGSTSMETRPSRPAVASYTGRRMSAAARTSAVVIIRTASSTVTPRSARSPSCSSYPSPEPMAAWKMEGLVVTPTTCLVSTSSARLPEAMRLRERSSSQMETPSSERRFRVTAVAVASVTVIIFLRAIGSTAGGGEGFPGGGGDVLGGETELGEQGVGVGGGTEVLQ